MLEVSFEVRAWVDKAPLAGVLLVSLGFLLLLAGTVGISRIQFEQYR